MAPIVTSLLAMTPSPISSPAPSLVKRGLAQIAASEVWVILGALLLIFSVAPKYYGKDVVLSFLANPYLTPVILMGVGLWFAGMMLQGMLVAKLAGVGAERPGTRSASLWVPIKAALLASLLIPVPGLTGSLLTHVLHQWVSCVA